MVGNTIVGDHLDCRWSQKQWNEIFKDSLLKCISPMSRSDESISLINCTLEVMDEKLHDFE